MTTKLKPRSSWSAVAFVILFILAIIASYLLFAFQVYWLDPSDACGTILASIREAGQGDFKFQTNCIDIVEEYTAMQQSAMHWSGAISFMAVTGLAAHNLGLIIKGTFGGNSIDVGSQE